MTEEERKAEQERLQRAVREQHETAEKSWLSSFSKTIGALIKGFFEFLSNIFSGKESGDGGGHEAETPPAGAGRRDLFNGIQATAAGTYAWAQFQQAHADEKVRHVSPILGKATVGSERGMRDHPIHHDRRMHHGIDLTGGTVIRSTADGVVLYSGWLGSFGNAIIIGHADGGYTVYGHLAQIEAKQSGMAISQGQSIGIMGASGGATGVHLHYEQRKGETSLTPVINGREIASGMTLDSAALPNLAQVGVTGGPGGSSQIAFRNSTVKAAAAQR